MRKTIGYMITFTTYGTWLQGDKRGYVKDGKRIGKNYKLEEENIKNLKTEAVHLTPEQRKIVFGAIIEKSMQLNQKVFALYVASNHIHITAEYIPKPIDIIVRHYKVSGQAALKKTGFTGKLWAKGYDRRFCFSKREMENRINYIKSHYDKKRFGVKATPA